MKVAEWITKHWLSLATGLLIVGLLFYGYGCESKVHSLTDNGKWVNRQELQLELDQIFGLAKLRMLDLDKQDQIKAVIFQNSLLLLQGQGVNPVGMITAICGIYGITQAGRNVTNAVKKKVNKGKVNNG